MENHFPFHNINNVENMMINLINEGESKMWQLIEKEKNAFKRCKQRKLYSIALNKIKKGK